MAEAPASKPVPVREQWSQDENYCQENLVPDKEISLPINGHTSVCSEVNCSNTSLIPNINKQCFNENNNHVIDKGNLRCPDEKPCCYYMKFPIKVNNNIYPDENNKKDGMDDYFQQYSSSSSTANNISYSTERMSSSFFSNHSSRLIDQLRSATNGGRRSPSYPDQINALNGEEEDEDNGCIYTYKGDNYEANLSHLLETCFSCGLPTSENSASQHGAVSIQRILTGSPHPNPQSNLYSPDMDFLEMDFDPGSAGDGGDSDCEDNNSILNADPKIDEQNSLESFSMLDSKIEKKTNYIPNEMKSLMCRRCEMCIYYEQKVNNTATSFNPKLAVESSIHKSIVSSKIEDRINLHSSNNSVNLFSNSQPDTLNIKSEKEGSNNLLENNLNAGDGEDNDEFSDGDEADDEGGDDSTSEHHPSDTNFGGGASLGSYFLPSSDISINNGLSTSNDFSKALSGVCKTNKQLRFSSETVCSKLSLNGQTGGDDKFRSNIESRTFNGETLSEFPESKSNCFYGADLSDKINPENNNLGSVSAPEVSPSKEYSPLQKFSRSISFHNQLSSPKYENVCFSHPYKDNFSSNVNKCQMSSGNSNEICNCKHGNSYHKNFQSSEVANLEACVDRLNQREKSVFNIASNSSNSPQHKRSPSRSLNQHVNACSSSISPANGNALLCQSSQEKSNFPNSISYSNATDSNFVMGDDNCDVNDNASHLLLPVKVLHHKSDDLSMDPNTACEGDLEGDHNDRSAKSSTIEKVMIWTERQATVRQVSQVGTSACGPTAVINVLLALDHPRPVNIVTSIIKTRLRAETGSLVEYLLSRSNAGTIHEDLLSGVQSISEGAITGRFFHMFPKRAFQLSRWLSHWIKKGGAPVATLNLQVAVSPNQTIPDAWHHQMVFGVGEQGIYLTNPLECVSDSLLSDQLCSDSILLVRRADIESRWDQNDKLITLSLQQDPRWNDMNVLGQVVCVLKEQAAPEMLQGRRHLTYHVAIPASYQSGVTIFIRNDNPSKAELFEEPELPLLDE